MVDITTQLEELDLTLAHARELVDGIRNSLPRDTAGWLDAAKDALVTNRVYGPEPKSQDNVSQLYSCEFCGAGPFKNELGLQIHEGRTHKKETRARKRSTSAVS